MSDDDIVADFERHVTDAGFGDGSEQPGGYFDDCGGPSDPDVTSYIYDNVRGEVAVLTVFPTDERAAVSGERLLSLSTPCDAYPGLVIRETRRLGPASYLVVWGVAGDDDSVFHERYDVNDRLIVVVSGNASRLEPLADLVLSWQPGVDGSSATARVSPPPSPPVPTPLPTVARDLALVRTLPAGAHTVDVLEGVTITLSEPRPVFLLEGLAGIYLDETYRGEVDIFHVYATSDGDRISSLADAVAYVESDPTFAGLSLVDEGPRTRTYSGTANESDTGFITGPRGVAAGDPSYWYAPNNLRITFIERPQGVIAITGEALAADADRFALAIPLMIELLDSMIVS